MISEMLNQLTDELGYAYKRASDAEAALATKDKEIERLRKALKDIADKYYCQCEPADTFDGEGPYLCNKCIARHALEARDE